MADAARAQAHFREKWEKLTGRTIEDEQAIMEEAGRLSEQLSVPVLVGLTIAQDKASVAVAERRLADGATWREALVWVGSYARFEYACALYERGVMPKEEFFPEIPDLWRGSDPDDMDPRFLKIWTEAWDWNGRRPLIDEGELPPGKFLTIYRGQDRAAKGAGIAWSLSEEVAQKFASGAALRMRGRDGVVHHAKVDRRKIMGYMTLRNEQEVIVNPLHLK